MTFLCKDCKYFGQSDPMRRFDRICERPHCKKFDPVYGNTTSTTLYCGDERRYGGCGPDGLFWEIQREVRP